MNISSLNQTAFESIYLDTQEMKSLKLQFYTKSVKTIGLRFDFTENVKDDTIRIKHRNWRSINIVSLIQTLCDTR